MTGNTAIFWPMIVQAALTLALYPVLFTRRKAAVRAGEAEVSAFRVPVSEPAGSAAAARAVVNQFELPVLFFVACLALYATNGASWLAVVVAWVFSLSRLVHAAVHLGRNRLGQRIPAFMVGYGCVVVLWLLVALHLVGLA